jgi:hypothetical protein
MERTADRAVRATLEMTSTQTFRATRAVVRGRSSCSRQIVRTVAFITTVLTAQLLTSCLTPEKTAWGIPREDIEAIRPLIRAQTSAPILSYQRDATDCTAILVLVRGKEHTETYRAKRVGGRWNVYYEPVIL